MWKIALREHAEHVFLAVFSVFSKSLGFYFSGRKRKEGKNRFVPVLARLFPDQLYCLHPHFLARGKKMAICHSQTPQALLE